MKPNTRIQQEKTIHIGREIGGDTETRMDQRQTNPRGPTWTWAQAEGGKGGRTDKGHGRKSRHAAQGAETSGGGWQVAGGDKVQLDDDPHREMMWRAGEREQ